MSGRKKIADIELVKILMDPRRREIFDLIKNESKTVTQIAEILGEKPSRLYYHVKKLEEAGLVKLVETKLQGNLVEKYYQAIPGFEQFELDQTLLSEHSDTVMGQVMNLVQPGLKMLSDELKTGTDQYTKQVSLNISFSEMTGKEWLESHQKMIASMKDRKDSAESMSKELETTSHMTPEQLEKKSQYAFVILSYRLDDAKDVE